MLFLLSCCKGFRHRFCEIYDCALFYLKALMHRLIFQKSLSTVCSLRFHPWKLLSNRRGQVRLRPKVAALLLYIRISTYPAASRTSYNSTVDDFHKLYTDCYKGELIYIITMEMKGTPLCLLLNNGSSNAIHRRLGRYYVSVFVNVRVCIYLG